MTKLVPWRRPSTLGLRRDIDDALNEFEMPRSIRREFDRLLGEEVAPTTMWREMERLFDDFVSPPSLRRRIARLFENVPAWGAGWGAGGLRGREAFVPQVELTERENDYLMRVDLPGLREQDVDIRVDDDNVVTISGERRDEETKRERGYEYTERTYGSFSRSVQLPRGVDTSKVEADFRNGVLEVHVPKSEAARPRHIPIGGREGAKEEPRIIAPGNGGTRASETQPKASR